MGDCNEANTGVPGKFYGHHANFLFSVPHFVPLAKINGFQAPNVQGNRIEIFF